jgi:hypothetical protein
MVKYQIPFASSRLAPQDHRLTIEAVNCSDVAKHSDAGRALAELLYTHCSSAFVEGLKESLKAQYSTPANYTALKFGDAIHNVIMSQTDWGIAHIPQD